MVTSAWVGKNKRKTNMKLIKLLTVGIFSLAIITAPVFANETDTKAKDACKDGAHKCCADAKKEGKACEKCTKKEEKK